MLRRYRSRPNGALLTASLAAVIIFGVLILGALMAAPAQTPVDASEAAAMEFAAIPPGRFLMGCSPGDGDCWNNERPPRMVEITRGFEIGRYEVTQAQWTAVMGSNPSQFTSPFNGADLPVENVAWNDVQEFLARLNALGDGYRYRLPTEAEWEYAARAGAAGAHYGNLNDIAWYNDNSEGRSRPVGSKQPNAWGLYDTIGNVSEWVEDWYDANAYAGGAVQDPAGPALGGFKILRGGSWFDFAEVARVSDRFNYEPARFGNFVGFRCVRERLP